MADMVQNGVIYGFSVIKCRRFIRICRRDDFEIFAGRFGHGEVSNALANFFFFVDFQFLMSGRPKLKLRIQFRPKPRKKKFWSSHEKLFIFEVLF